jgi:uncharacterized membrane protein YqjE
MPNPVRTLLGSATGFAHSRLALLGTELREELGRFAFLLLGGCAAIVLAALGLAVAAAALILAAGEAHRLVAASVLAGLFIAGATYAAARVRRALDAKPMVLAASLAELERDREALVGSSQAQRSALAESGGELLRLVSIGMLAYSVGRRLRRAA